MRSCPPPPLPQSLGGDFVGGVLSEEELGNKLFVHVVEKVGLAACFVLFIYLFIPACAPSNQKQRVM